MHASDRSPVCTTTAAAVVAPPRVGRARGGDGGWLPVLDEKLQARATDIAHTLSILSGFLIGPFAIGVFVSRYCRLGVEICAAVWLIMVVASFIHLIREHQ